MQALANSQPSLEDGDFCLVFMAVLVGISCMVAGPGCSRCRSSGNSSFQQERLVGRRRETCNSQIAFDVIENIGSAFAFFESV